MEFLYFISKTMLLGVTDIYDYFLITTIIIIIIIINFFNSGPLFLPKIIFYFKINYILILGILSY